MAAGESQCCSLAERGCVRRSFFVFFWYASKAVLKRFWKLVEEVLVEEALDIVSVSKNVGRRDGVVVVSFNRPGTTSSGGVLVLVQASLVLTPYSVLHAHSRTCTIAATCSDQLRLQFIAKCMLDICLLCCTSSEHRTHPTCRINTTVSYTGRLGSPSGLHVGDLHQL